MKLINLSSHFVTPEWQEVGIVDFDTAVLQPAYEQALAHGKKRARSPIDATPLIVDLKWHEERSRVVKESNVDGAVFDYKECGSRKDMVSFGDYIPNLTREFRGI